MMGTHVVLDMSTFPPSVQMTRKPEEPARQWLHRAGLEAHGFDELLAHYTAIGDALLSHGMEATEGEDATLAVVYRAYKKMVLADYLNTTGTAQTI